MSPEDYLKQGDLSGTLSALQDQVRSNPADAKLRVFLFQLLCVQGDWHRALTQLNVAGELDSQTFPMVQTYRETLRCEALRDTVFSTDRQPLVLGEPERWIALWLEALRQANDGKLEDAATLREEAFDAGADVTEISGKLLLADEQEVAFEWLADGDTRIGPFFEAIVNGGYYWIPLNRVHSLTLDSPADLRDLGQGFGDIAVTPSADSGASYVLLWPYARPWRLLRVQPVLRAIADAGRAAEILAEAIETDTQERASHVATPVEEAPELPAAVEEPKRWQPYPTVPLAAAASLIVITLVATAWVSLSGNRPATYVTDNVVTSVDLLFVDLDDGSLEVLDAANGNTLGTLEPDADGFLRSTLRAMARARRAAGEDVDAAFAIKQTSDNRLLLVDTVTDQRVDLWAFGPTNAAAFARFLPTKVTAEVTTTSSEDSQVSDSAMRVVAHTNQETAQ